MSTESGEVQALVDGVSEVVTLVEDRIEAVTGAGIALWERYVKGIVRFENRMIVIIEPGGLFSIEEINMLHAA